MHGDAQPHPAKKGLATQGPPRKENVDPRPVSCPPLHPNLDRGPPSPPFLVAVCPYLGWALGCNLATECCAVGCPGNQGSLSLGLLGVPGRGSTLCLSPSTLLRRLEIPEGEWQWHGRSTSDWSSRRKRLRECCQERVGGVRRRVSRQTEWSSLLLESLQPLGSLAVGCKGPKRISSSDPTRLPSLHVSPKVLLEPSWSLGYWNG